MVPGFFVNFFLQKYIQEYLKVVARVIKYAAIGHFLLGRVGKG